ncbi:MAG: hypothetical protein HOP17_04225 [Acidobacteria bacterium]|nr:hypothetical protein [Acidobacteriota bacterium]
MLTRIYATSWIVLAFIAGVIFLTGNFSMLVGVAFGFICFGMIFMGMMFVLPSTVVHPAPPHSSVRPGRQSSFLDRSRAFGRRWFSTNGVEVRKPKYH